LRRFRGRNYKWWAFLALSIGLFSSVAYQGSIIIALPSIVDEFGTDLPTTQWVLIAYALTISAFLLPMGRVADMVGRKPVYLLGFTFFVIGAGIAGSSGGILVMILATAFQGLGAAMTQGTSMAMIISTFPSNERGKALGLQMSVVGAGGIAGPAVGGLMIAAIDWRWAFYGNMLLAAVALLAALVVVDSRRAGRGSADQGSFDWPGAVLSAGALVSFLMGMTWGPRIGWAHPGIAAAMVIFVGLLVAFLWWELRCPTPMLDVRLFKRKLFSMGILASYVSFVGMSPMRFLMPFYLQAVLGFSPGKVGLVIVPASAMMIVAGPLSGRFSDRFGVRPFTIAGTAFSIMGVLLLSTLTPSSSVLVVMAGLMMQGFGGGTFYAPNNSSVLSAVEQSKYGVISAFLNLVRNAGNLTGIAVATAIVTASMGSLGYAPSLAEVSADGDTGLIAAFTGGLRLAYLSMVLFLAVAMGASVFKGRALVQGSDEAPQEQPEEGRTEARLPPRLGEPSA
jgi:EmrB/QacA subfamily drug resistance transporter